jgi:hypothetical protein
LIRVESELIAGLLASKRKFLFLGEAGSGKSELAINFALAFAGATERPIHFFDMDQTKPLFRSREAKDTLIGHGVRFHSASQLMDAPTVPYAVVETIADEANLSILDVGGNAIGARCMGQFAHLLNAADAVAYFVVNYYRPFSQNRRHIEETLAAVGGAARVERFEVISNPNLGAQTRTEDVLLGHDHTCAMFADSAHQVSLLAILDTLVDERIRSSSQHVIRIKRHIVVPWSNEARGARVSKGVDRLA